MTRKQFALIAARIKEELLNISHLQNELNLSRLKSRES
jgi:hypothetical protein